jgi:hypothetical protein
VVTGRGVLSSARRYIGRVRFVGGDDGLRMRKVTGAMAVDAGDRLAERFEAPPAPEGDGLSDARARRYIGRVRFVSGDDGVRMRKVTGAMAVDDGDWLAERFEAHRPPLRALAYFGCAGFSVTSGGSASSVGMTDCGRGT